MTDDDWATEAACRGLDPDLFFPATGGEYATTKAALATCAICTVREPCLEWAVVHELRGVWGGTTGRQRIDLRRSRGITISSPQSQYYESEASGE